MRTGLPLFTPHPPTQEFLLPLQSMVPDMTHVVPVQLKRASDRLDPAHAQLACPEPSPQMICPDGRVPQFPVEFSAGSESP